MKKIIIIALALMMVAGMAYAEDRLSLSGSLFVRGWDQEGYSGKYTRSYDSNDEASWWEQRFRLGGKIAVADDVSVNFRMDIGEGVWGLDYVPGAISRPGNGNPARLNTKLDVDRGFIKIDKQYWDLTAGQQYMGLGIVQVFDVNATGFNLGIKPVDNLKVSLLYARFDENGSTTDEGDTEDVDRYAANVAYTADTFGAKVFYIMGNDGTDTDDSPMALGVNGNVALGMFNVQGELAYLGGDTNAGAIDYTGLQLFLGADANITETIKLGVDGYYAKGTDDPNEIQLTNLGDWDSFTPFSFTGVPEWGGFATAMPSWDVFDPFGISGGVVGGDLFAEFTFIEKLSLGGRVGFFQAQEDVALPGAELTAYTLWANYLIATNTNVGIVYMVSSPDDDNNNFKDDAKLAVAQLHVAF